jgi:TPP-dependent pyruvate/acetoin dehydrogenase alpha subunit
MCELRAFEEVVAAAHADGRLPGLLHLAIGAEAVAVGVLGAMSDADRVYTSHRPHAHFLMAGSSPGALMAELAGREQGLCRGRGGSMHLMDERAVLATGVVGGTLSIAVGHALAQPSGAVVLAFFGDGAVQTGAFHEAMNLAALWEVPVLWVCENNGWAEFSERSEHTRVGDVSRYGELYRIPAASVDGTDVEAVAEAAQRLLDHVRSGAGPALLETHFTRLRPHYEGDWRAQGADGARDALEVESARLIERGAEAAALAAVRERAWADALDCLEQALRGGEPRPEEDAGLVYAAAPW